MIQPNIGCKANVTGTANICCKTIIPLKKIGDSRNRVEGNYEKTKIPNGMNNKNKNKSGKFTSYEIEKLTNTEFSPLIEYNETK